MSLEKRCTETLIQILWAPFVLLWIRSAVQNCAECFPVRFASSLKGASKVHVLN
jgi:hypothetical protein